MLKGLGDISKLGGMLKQAMEMKQRIEELKEALGHERVEGSAGGGMVKVEMTGKMEVLSVTIDPEIIDKNDPQTLETMVRAAVNAATDKARELMETRMKEIAGGINIPGLV